MGIPVILDTDIGSDIDDAVALAYLLAQPECDLLGITTVSGSVRQRAMLADAQCRASNCDIPVLVGCEEPMLVPQVQPDVPQAEALANWAHSEDFGELLAVEWLRRTIRSRPGEITLLAIGPLTNIGLLFRLDPEVPAMLKELVLMGGRYGNPIAGLEETEWNIRCDPHAAAMVFSAPVPSLRAVGIGMTRQVTMQRREVEESFSHRLLEPVLDFAGAWFRHGGDLITFHDPLAAAAIFKPDLCEWESGVITVDLDSPRLQGFTHWQAEAGGRHKVAKKVDRDSFFKEYFSVFNEA